MVNPEPLSAMTMLYNPPVSEFSVYRTVLEPGASDNHRSIDGPSIVIVTEGQGTVHCTADERCLELKPGVVFFVGAGTGLSFNTKDGPLHLYRAFVEVD
jgi:mannose-6-phosphate isomerase